MEYKEKLKLAKEALDSGSYDKETIEYIFPELAESEDERIRKELISFFKDRKSRLDRMEDILDPSNFPCDDYSLCEKAISWLEKQGEQKPAEWSEEDEARIESCIKLLQTSDGYDTINAKWLKSLKYRVQPQPKQEWSKEDERTFSNINLYIRKAGDYPHFNKENIKEAINWLKSLRPQSSWKPSDEQMNTLWDAIVYVEGCNSNFKGSGSVLENLYNDLKKLKA